MAAQTAPSVDYDTDDDGLIEIDSQVKLEAIRYDLNGSGTVAATDAASYASGFPNALSTQCPSSNCSGYELTANLTLTGNWTPIGSSSGAAFAATFDGDGYTISGLTVTGGNAAGLFGFVGSGGVIRDLGLLNASVTTNILSGAAGAIVGVLASGAEVNSSYAAGGTISGAANSARVGGLVGGNGGTIRASYATSAVTISGAPNSNRLGGLVGNNTGSIIASYAAGAVAGTGGNNNNYGGLVGRSATAGSTITNSYCDSQTTGPANCIGLSVSPAAATAAGQTTSALQTTSSYTGIFSAWNVNTDGVTGGDDPWYFGATYQYPQPSYRAPTTPAVDYDADDDNLIDIGSVAQLHAMRHDLDGDGTPETGEDDPYLSGFPGRETAAVGRMGCPNTCAGYELTGDLTFPATGALANWTPIGESIAAPFNTTFEGHGHTLTGLTVNLSAVSNAGMFNHAGGSAVIRNLGFINPSITSSSTGVLRHGVLASQTAAGSAISAVYVSGGSVTTAGVNAYAGGLIGEHRGTLRASYSNATIAASGNPDAVSLGGLVGYLHGGRITASYAAGTVTEGSGNNVNHGGLVGRSKDRSGGTGAAIAVSYCSAASGEATCIGTQTSTTLTAVRYSASALQTPTDYTGIYRQWNLDVDGDGGLDYVWNFGANNEYPALNTPAQRLAAAPAVFDYDANDNGLIDISTAAQLNAVRWDLNGDGHPDTADAVTAYGTVWAGRQHAADAGSHRMGCPLTTPTAGCVGYELTADLNLATDYPAWTPLGIYTATFDGNGYTISGMTVNTAAADAGLFSRLGSSGIIRELGLISPSVTITATASTAGGLAGHLTAGSLVHRSYVQGGSITAAGIDPTYIGGITGIQDGTIRASYATAAIRTDGSRSNTHAGGLTGIMQNQAAITASYAAGTVAASGTGTTAGGLVGRSSGSGPVITNSYCDSTVGLSSCIGSHLGGSTAAAAAHATGDLQQPTSYAGLYLNWNIDTDGDSNLDDPWEFGSSSQYPTLRLPVSRPIAIPYIASDSGLRPQASTRAAASNRGAGRGEPYRPASAHPEIYANPRYAITVSCAVAATGTGEAARTTATLTLNLGLYTRPYRLTLSLWDGQYFRTLQSQGLPTPELQQDGRTVTVEVATDPAQTRFRLDSQYGLNLVLGYADCHTDDP